MSTRIDTDLPFSVGVVNSEISSDVDVGVAVAADLGMSQIEIEDFWGRAAHECDDPLIERTRNAVERGGLYVSSVGTQAFKVLILPPGDVRDPTAIDGWDQHRIELEGGIRVAQALDSPFVRIFSCRRDDMIGMGNPSPRLPDGGPLPDDRLAGIVTVLRDAGDRAAAADVTLLVENVRSCWGNTAVNTVRILEATDHPRVKLNWDPSNDFVSGGNPYPPGYEVARPWTQHVHIKDARVVDHESGLIAWECVGHGEVDFVGQLRALIDDGFAGAVNLETHWHPEHRSKEANSRESFAGMLEVLELAQRNGA